MRDLVVHRREPTEQRREHAPRPPNGATIASGDLRLIDGDTGAVVAIQAHPPMPWATDLARSLRSVRWSAKGGSKGGSEPRLSGFVNEHRTFGFAAPVPLRRRYGCSPCEFDREYPRITARLAEFVRLAWDVFSTAAHAESQAHARLVTDAILPAWRFAGMPWTSGIINGTAALPYHRDAGNLAGSWSAMLGLRRKVDGGLLHLAEYDVWLPVADRSITVFDGQGVLHGVSPLSARPGGHRYTIVTYAKAGMRECLSGDAEVRRAQARRTVAEDRERDRRQAVAP